LGGIYRPDVIARGFYALYQRERLEKYEKYYGSLFTIRGPCMWEFMGILSVWNMSKKPRCKVLEAGKEMG